jgi:hypothetical protein
MSIRQMWDSVLTAHLFHEVDEQELLTDYVEHFLCWSLLWVDLFEELGDEYCH